MSYLVLARKWRPQVFEELLGQDHVVKTLKNALTKGRIAHAYLFAGPRGTGKTTIARILAKAMNCAEGPTPEPCNRCRSCLEITGGNAADVYEIDGASNNGVEQVRELRYQASQIGEMWMEGAGFVRIMTVHCAKGLTIPAVVLPAIDYQLDTSSPCLLYTSPSPRDLSTSRLPSSA